MINQKLQIGKSAVFPGQRCIVTLPIPNLYEWLPLELPLHVLHGKEAGPTLCITAALHGDEINGIEIIRKLLKHRAFKHLKGTLIAVPILNIYGFLYQKRYLMDRRDLNRSFPGSEKGSVAARLANLISKEIMTHATHTIDLHSGSSHRVNLPQIRLSSGNTELNPLAEAFGAPVIIDSPERPGSLRQMLNQAGKPCLVYEGGEALRFDNLTIKIGIKGILNVMKHLGMINLTSKQVKCPPAYAKASYWIRSPSGGLLISHSQLGNRVHVDQKLATLVHPFSKEEMPVLSPVEGILIGKNNLPLVHEGAALFNIATFEKYQLQTERVQVLMADESLDDNTLLFS